MFYVPDPDVNLFDDRNVRRAATTLAESAGIGADHAGDFAAGWANAPAQPAPDRPPPDFGGHWPI